MQSYALKIDGTLQEDELNHGLFLFLRQINKIPPHLGIICFGRVYDITFQGPNIGLEVKKFMVPIHEKGLPTVFVKMVVPHASSKEMLRELVKEQIMKCPRVDGNTSCLSPIKGLIQNLYAMEVKRAAFIFELLPLLEKSKLIEGNYVVHINGVEKLLTLPKYTKEDMDRYLALLNRKYNANAHAG